MRSGTVERLLLAWADDLFAIVEGPSPCGEAAITGTSTQTGAVSRYEAVILLTPAQIDGAVTMTIGYTRPGC